MCKGEQEWCVKIFLDVAVTVALGRRRQGDGVQAKPLPHRESEVSSLQEIGLER